MDAKFTGPGTDLNVEFLETKPGLATEKVSTVPQQAAKYNPRDGKLPIAHWAANKGTEIHWHAAVRAHLKMDDGHEIDEATFDKALDEVKNIKLG